MEAPLILVSRKPVDQPRSCQQVDLLLMYFMAEISSHLPIPNREASLRFGAPAKEHEKLFYNDTSFPPFHGDRRKRSFRLWLS